MQYVCITGCRQTGLPAGHGPGSTAHRRFQDWQANGMWSRMLKAAILAAHKQDRLQLEAAVSGIRDPKTLWQDPVMIFEIIGDFAEKFRTAPSPAILFIANNENTFMASKEASPGKNPSIVEEVKKMIEGDPEIFRKLSYK